MRTVADLANGIDQQPPTEPHGSSHSDNPVMHVPSRVLYGGRQGAPLALIAATAAVTLLFASTPFLITPLSEHYGISEGFAGSISVAQVGAFAAVNFIFPRLLRPSGKLLRVAAISLVILNLLSVFAGLYAVLLVLRVLAGAAAGTMTWLTWSNAMKRKSSMSSIAATGPMTALLAAPLMALISGWGDQAIYATLAIAAVPAAVLWAPVAGRKRAKGVISGSRSNRILLASLFALTFFGSSLFINQTIVARDIHGLTAFTSSIAFSMNAAGAIAGARLSTRIRYPGWFLASIGPAAVLTVIGPTWMFYVGMTWWGFAFWVGVPGVLQMLVDRSLEPSERAGDAQGVMALGRAFGPALGGAFVDAGALVALAVTSATGIAIAGTSVIGVKEGREHLPPTDDRTIDQHE
ncbi:MAG: MFS transporter [Actinomycetia bacterium]|nr:MFS transporter [Actinomycetes bacterium]